MNGPHSVQTPQKSVFETRNSKEMIFSKQPNESLSYSKVD